MSGFARYLPLSSRDGHDESDVTSDRRAALADVVEAASALASAAAQDAPELAQAFAVAARLERELAAATGDAAGDAGMQLHRLADGVRRGPRRSVRALAEATRALLLLGRSLSVDVTLDPLVAGAVSLWAATSASADRRAVVRGRTVRASDADWAFGTGPVLTATATQIAAFLLGVSDDPPRPVSARG